MRRSDPGTKRLSARIAEQVLAEGRLQSETEADVNSEVRACYAESVESLSRRVKASTALALSLVVATGSSDPGQLLGIDLTASTQNFLTLVAPVALSLWLAHLAHAAVNVSNWASLLLALKYHGAKLSVSRSLMEASVYSPIESRQRWSRFLFGRDRRLIAADRMLDRLALVVGLAIVLATTALLAVRSWHASAPLPMRILTICLSVILTIAGALHTWLHDLDR